MKYLDISNVSKKIKRKISLKCKLICILIIFLFILIYINIGLVSFSSLYFISFTFLFGVSIVPFLYYYIYIDYVKDYIEFSYNKKKIVIVNGIIMFFIIYIIGTIVLLNALPIFLS